MYRLRNGKTIEIKQGDFHQANGLLQQDEFGEQTDYENDFHREFHFAYFKNQPVGFYNLAFYPFPNQNNDRIGELEFVFVSPDHRNQHLGSILTAHSVLQITGLSLEIFKIIACDKQGRMKQILEKLGFETETPPEKHSGVFNINLHDQEPVRETFQNYLNRLLF